MVEPTNNLPVVYVPRQPGPLVNPRSPSKRPDEIDDVLDDLFGSEDERGPGVADAVLIGAGITALVGSQLFDMATFVTVLGVGMILLGSILPIRWALQRLKSGQQRSLTAKAVGDATALRTGHPTLDQLVDQYTHVHERAGQLESDTGARLVAVAHGLVDEVATLLGGELPTGPAELEYTDARAASLAELAASLDDPRLADGGHGHRSAIVEARIEIEQVSGGSALTDWTKLRDELLPNIDD